MLMNIEHFTKKKKDKIRILNIFSLTRKEFEKKFDKNNHNSYLFKLVVLTATVAAMDLFTFFFRNKISTRLKKYLYQEFYLSTVLIVFIRKFRFLP